MTKAWTIEPLAWVESPYREKFAIPRQPGLAPDVPARVVMAEGFRNPDLLRGLDAFSHIWLIFGFHGTASQGWRPTVRPPRLGGNQRLGVLATRSTFRPNALGLSVVRLDEICREDATLYLRVRGADLLHGTPVFDIKPYLPYADCVSSAEGGFAPQAPSTMPVHFLPAAEQQLARHQAELPHLRDVIVAALQHDPRPAYRQIPDDDRTYGVHLYHFNVTWQVRLGEAVVLSVVPGEEVEG